jgi:hypothetical protein
MKHHEHTKFVGCHVNGDQWENIDRCTGRYTDDSHILKWTTWLVWASEQSMSAWVSADKNSNKTLKVTCWQAKQLAEIWVKLANINYGHVIQQITEF